METSTWNLRFVSPFFLTVHTNGSVTHNGLIYGFNNGSHSVTQQIRPDFTAQFNHFDCPENHRDFSSADLSAVLIIMSCVTRNTSPKQNFH